MAPAESDKSIQASKEELEVISNRIQIALAKREKLIKSWTAKSARAKEPEKTEKELEVEDAALFRSEPPYLGVGAPIPSQFLTTNTEQQKKSLRAKLLPGKGLKASKQRDEEEKAASLKRGLQDDSSDDEGGRSTLGKAKKQKTLAPFQPKGDLKNTKLDAKSTDPEVKIHSKDKVQPKDSATLVTPPITPPKHAIETQAEEPTFKKTGPAAEQSGCIDNQDDRVPEVNAGAAVSLQSSPEGEKKAKEVIEEATESSDARLGGDSQGPKMESIV